MAPGELLIPFKNKDKQLTIEGELIADPTRDLTLTAGWIMVHGALRFGTAAEPYRKRALITLNGPASDDVMGMGARGLGVMGGVVEMFGEPRDAWTTLDANAPAGATTLTLATAPPWRPGDRLVVASTDLDPLQFDAVTITVIQGQGTALYTPLEQYGGADSHTDIRSDIFAFGATLYHLLTNEPPADARKRFLQPESLVPLREINPALSARTERAAPVPGGLEAEVTLDV